MIVDATQTPQEGEPDADSNADSMFSEYAAGTDWFLQQIVRFANEWTMEIGITLQVGGMLVSGTVISGEKYFETFAKSFAAGFVNDLETGKAMGEFIAQYKALYEKQADGSKAPNLAHPAQFIHLRNAQYWHQAGNPIPGKQGTLWRGRIAEVGGFHLGKFDVAP
jgi:hypothetical protein